MNVNTVRMSQEDLAMANLRQFVIAKYHAAPRQSQIRAHQFFNAMDSDGNGSVDYAEFKYFLVSEGFEYYAGRNLFMKLDGDGNRGLDFWEVMTLYYILKSGRPFCFWCDHFLCDVYFACNDCRGGPYYFCNNCYQCHLQEHRFSVQPMGGPSMQRSQTSNAMVQPMWGPSMQRSQTMNSNGMTMYASGSNPSQSPNYYMAPVPVPVPVNTSPMWDPSFQRSQTMNSNGMMYASGSNPSQSPSNYYMAPVPVPVNTSGKDKKSSVRTAYRAFEVGLGIGNLAVGVASCFIM